MSRYLLQKLLRLVIVMFIVSILTFVTLNVIPGDQAIEILGPDASAEEYEALRGRLDVNKPIVNQYLGWIVDAGRGDFGQSVIPPTQDVTEMVKARLPVTAQIAVTALLIALVVSVPLAAWQAYRAGTRFDRIATATTFGVISIPSFLSGLLLIFAFVFHADAVRQVVLIAGAVGAAALLVQGFRARISDKGERRRELVARVIRAAAVVVVAFLFFRFWPNLPRQGFSRLTSDNGISENLRSSLLPALTLALPEIAVFTRLLRNDMISTLQEDFILAARAKGMSTAHILVREAMRPSLFSLITIGGVALGRLLGGTVIVEAVFALPGMGTLLISNIHNKDVPVVAACVLVLAFLYVTLNAIIDLLYEYLDPRLRRARR
jgi:peptide/nickel transport system permease protein